MLARPLRAKHVDLREKKEVRATVGARLCWFPEEKFYVEIGQSTAQIRPICELTLFFPPRKTKLSCVEHKPLVCKVGRGNIRNSQRRVVRELVYTRYYYSVPVLVKNKCCEKICASSMARDCHNPSRPRKFRNP